MLKKIRIIFENLVYLYTVHCYIFRLCSNIFVEQRNSNTDIPSQKYDTFQVFVDSHVCLNFKSKILDKQKGFFESDRQLEIWGHEEIIFGEFDTYRIGSREQ